MKTPLNNTQQPILPKKSLGKALFFRSVTGIAIATFTFTILVPVLLAQKVSAADASWTPAQVTHATWAFTNPTTIAVKIGTTTINLTYQGKTGLGRAFTGNGAPLCSALLLYIPEASITDNAPNKPSVIANVANFKYNQTLLSGGSTGCGTPSSGPGKATINTTLAGNLGGGAQAPPAVGGICSPGGATSGSLLCKCAASGAPPVTKCAWVSTATDPAVDDTPTCENSDRLGLGWLFCKILRGIDSAVTAFYDEVQDQLCVKVDTAVTVNGTPINSGTDGGVKCGNKENLFTPQLYEVWSNIRVIATSLLVILMLVAIIGQAVSGGKR